MTVKIPDGGYLPKGYKAALDEMFTVERSSLPEASQQNTRGPASTMGATPGTGPQSKLKKQSGRKVDKTPKSRMQPSAEPQTG